MLLKPAEYYKIKPILGEPLEYESRGGFFLKKVLDHQGKGYALLIQSKCTFQKYEYGLLVYFSINNKVTALPIPNTSIIISEYIEGEYILPKKWSLLWWLSKPGEPRKESNIYLLKTVDLELEFSSIAYSEPGANQFFNPINKTSTC